MQRRLTISGLLALLLIGGCSSEQLQRFGFTLGSQYACMQRNRNLPNEAVRNADCNATDPQRQRAWETYQRERGEAASN